MCPLFTIDRLGVDCSSDRENGKMVRAFKGSKSIAVGEVALTLEIGPCQFAVPLVVVDIPVTFNMLLGCSWIHIVRAIPSNLTSKGKINQRR